MKIESIEPYGLDDNNDAEKRDNIAQEYRDSVYQDRKDPPYSEPIGLE